jgi:hypothetical protein
MLSIILLIEPNVIEQRAGVHWAVRVAPSVVKCLRSFENT